MNNHVATAPKTRDGARVELLTINGRGDYPFVGYVGEDPWIYIWKTGGFAIGPDRPSGLDLINIPK